jgi:hypothetical protein
MELSLQTPALLFPALSLLLLAYLNRFLAIASLIRQLHAKYIDHPEEIVLRQLKNLKRRVRLIRDMQIAGVTSIFLDILCMFLIYVEAFWWANALFVISLALLLLSLGMSIWEITLSTKALFLEISDIEALQKDEGLLKRLRKPFNGSK